jgi:DNA-binding response OmpR family regulator
MLFWRYISLALAKSNSDCSLREARMLRVLIAEDDLMIADLIEETLVAHGYEVCGIASTVAEGIALGRLHQPDFAIIDMRLADGGLGTDLAFELDRAHLGIVFALGILYATGNISLLLQKVADGDACLAKPYRPEDLMRSLKIVTDMIIFGIASPPFPRGFQLLDGAIH